MADSYTLPEFDPCHSTLEGFKSTVDFHLKAYLQAVQYQRYGGSLSSGSNAAHAAATWRGFGQPSPIQNHCGRLHCQQISTIRTAHVRNIFISAAQRLLTRSARHGFSTGRPIGHKSGVASIPA